MQLLVDKMMKLSNSIGGLAARMGGILDPSKDLSELDAELQNSENGITEERTRLIMVSRMILSLAVATETAYLDCLEILKG